MKVDHEPSQFEKASALAEKRVGRAARLVLGGAFGLEPADFLLQLRDALGQLVDRQERKVLADLVDPLFPRRLVVEDAHQAPPSALLGPPDRLDRALQ